MVKILARHYCQDAIFYLLLALPMPIWVVIYSHDSSIEEIESYALVQVILVLPVLEEVLFRGVLQPWIATKYTKKLIKISHANIITSATFALLHLFTQPVLMALCTFIPSLIFGFAKERYSRLLPSIILHSSYNGGYFFWGTKLLNNEIMSPIPF